ncbi:mechanosensitive ion channel family protein [Halohasta litorea]|uniref:Mechanosensitive ion channel family protein n=1 Tax=Halohasta litorea TaxID=869891 RepID=A0ABD6D9M1_9EURY|nr:mechanosensitive ion channel family protein [Halohasta litorea]
MVTEIASGVGLWLVDNTQRLLVTVAVLGGLIGLKQLVDRWRRDREVTPRIALVISAVLAVCIAGGLSSLVAVWGLTGTLYSAYDGVDLGRQIANIVLSVVILGGAYALSDFVGHLIKDLAREQNAISEHEREILHRTTQITIYAFALLVVIGLFTDNIGSLLVGAGFLGVVVGMAARQTLGAVLAGFVIMFSKPFEVGDWVVIGEDEGTVTEITIVNTRIQSFDGEYVMVPNDTVTSNPVRNRTRRGRLRIEVDVGVDYETDPERAGEIATDAVSEVDRILDVPAPQVVGKEFGESSIVLGVRGWIENPSARRRWQARTRMIAAIREAFAAEDIKIPFPQRELSGRAETGGFRLADGEQSVTERPSQDGTSVKKQPQSSEGEDDD